MRKKAKVLLVGWDAADWKVIDDLIDKGLMPTMKKFLQEGVRGRVATLDPPLSPMLWTSIATGVRPQKHGILGFVEPDPKGGNVRPVSSKSRKVKAIWNILSQSNLRSNVIGWWPSNPVEPINGCMVSNFYQQERKNKKTVEIDKWEMPEGTVHPDKWIETLKELRVHPSEITGNLVMPFIPRALDLKAKDDEAFGIIVKYLAHATSIHAACTELMLNEDWDFTAVYHDAIDHFSHAFMKFHPPRQEHIDPERYELLKDAVTGAYIFHDMMLERLLKIIDQETTVIICYDHGFHSDHLRPRMLPHVPSGPAIEHSPYGVFAIKGPGIKKNDKIFGASILDITPTILTLFDLPIGKNMDGKPLVNIYENQHSKKIQFIDSWENISGDSGELDENSKDDPISEMDAIEQLIELGYVEAPSDDKDDYVKTVAKENKFYLAKSHSCAGEYEDAVNILEEIIDFENPDFRWVIECVNSCLKSKQFEKGKKYLDLVKDKNLISSNYLNVLEAKLLLALNEPNKAIELLNLALKEFSNSAEINIELAKVFNALRKLPEAEKLFIKAIEIDEGNSYAHHGLGLVYLRQKKYEDAINCFLDAIKLTYYYPYAHFHLGEALVLIGEHENAEKAFEQVALMNPNIKKTFKWLYDIQKIVGNKKKEDYYRQILDKIIKGNITVITGLPGKKLKATLLALDKKGNINGEFESLNFSENFDFDFTGKFFEKNNNETIYVPINFLGSLPVIYDYKIIYINDNFNDVLKYFSNENNVFGSTENYDLNQSIHLEKQIDNANLWLNQQPDLDLFYIEKEDTIDDVVSILDKY